MAQSYEITEEFLNEFRPIIGNDFMRYKNHVDRVFLLCLKLDDNKENLQKYAIAAVYHHIGI